MAKAKTVGLAAVVSRPAEMTAARGGWRGIDKLVTVTYVGRHIDTGSPAVPMEMPFVIVRGDIVKQVGRDAAMVYGFLTMRQGLPLTYRDIEVCGLYADASRSTIIRCVAKLRNAGLLTVAKVARSQRKRYTCHGHRDQDPVQPENGDSLIEYQQVVTESSSIGESKREKKEVSSSTSVEGKFVQAVPIDRRDTITNQPAPQKWKPRSKLTNAELDAKYGVGHIDDWSFSPACGLPSIHPDSEVVPNDSKDQDCADAATKILNHDVQAIQAMIDDLRGDTPESQLSAAQLIYDAYPRHVGKRAALPAIKRSLGRFIKQSSATDPAGALMDIVKKYAVSVQDKERKFIPYPSTWFNQDRWEDEEDTGPADEGEVNAPYSGARATCGCPMDKNVIYHRGEPMCSENKPFGVREPV